MLREKIKEAAAKIDLLSREKKIRIISHFDTDGITSAAIFSFRFWTAPFSLASIALIIMDFFAMTTSAFHLNFFFII